MDLCFGQIRQHLTTITIFLAILFPIGILSADRPIWTRAEWQTELETLRLKSYPHISNRSREVRGILACGLRPPRPNLTISPCPDMKQICETEEFGCETTDHRKKLIQNEIILRKNYKSFGEDCNSSGTAEGESLLNPPKANDFNINEFKYLIWQDKLIDSGLAFCDPFLFLQCSAQGKCGCKKGTLWVGDKTEGNKRPEIKNTCGTTDGVECANFAESESAISYYNVFSSINYEENTEQLISSALCLQGNCTMDLLSDVFKGEFTCLYDNTPLLGLSESIQNYFDQDKLKGAFGDDCNIQNQNQLFTFTKEEEENIGTRINNLLALEKRNTPTSGKFCDRDFFLTCNPSTSKCDCEFPAVWNTAKNFCTFPPEFNKCEPNSLTNEIMNNRTLSFSTRTRLLMGWEKILTTDRDCGGGKRVCHVEPDNKDEIYCRCPERTTGGVDCEVPLTKFLLQIRTLSFPTDVASPEEKLKVFLELNALAIELEKIFTLGLGVACDQNATKAADLVVGRILRLNRPGTKMTREDYTNLNKQIVEFALANQESKLCNVSLTCHLETHTCVTETREEYLFGLQNKLLDFSTVECGQRGCSPFPQIMGKPIDLFTRTGRIQPDAKELFAQEIQRIMDLLNANVKPKYCVRDTEGINVGREHCDATGTCTRCTPTGVIQPLGLNKNMTTNMAMGNYYNSLSGQIVILTTLLILNI